MRSMYKSIVYSFQATIRRCLPKDHLCSHYSLSSSQHLLPGGDQVALCPRVVRPATSQRRATRLLCVILHALLQLRSEVANESLDRPCKGLAKS